MCPLCQNIFPYIIKKGFFHRAPSRRGGPGRRVQKYLCKTCMGHFSSQTDHSTYRERKPHLNREIFRLLASGLSQRHTARLVRVHQDTVAAKMERFGKLCSRTNLQDRMKRSPTFSSVVVFDEMETFEHSKLKPLSIAVAVDERTRYLFGANVSQMPAKGLLRDRSIKKYGYRQDFRRPALHQLLNTVAYAVPHLQLLKSDECPRYPGPVRVLRRRVPDLGHERHKGRRGCVVGQGELKAGGFDPLFSLNHSCAMIRDYVKRLSRRTWCTTKVPEGLQMMLNIYISVHNHRVLEQDAGVKDGWMLAPRPPQEVRWRRRDHWWGPTKR